MKIFKNKVFLISGGFGSFSNAVLRRFLDSDIHEIRIFSCDKKKQDDMHHALQNPKVKFCICNVRDKFIRRRDHEKRGLRVSAATLKQVSSCEFFPVEAVRTNIVCTENVLNSAIEHGVENVVVLSTDRQPIPLTRWA